MPAWEETQGKIVSLSTVLAGKVELDFLTQKPSPITCSHSVLGHGMWCAFFVINRKYLTLFPKEHLILTNSTGQVASDKNIKINSYKCKILG